MKTLLATTLILSALVAVPVYAATAPFMCSIIVTNSLQGVTVNANLVDMSNGKSGGVLAGKKIPPGASRVLTAVCTGVTQVRVIATQASAPGNPNPNTMTGIYHAPVSDVQPNSENGGYANSFIYPGNFPDFYK